MNLEYILFVSIVIHLILRYAPNRRGERVELTLIGHILVFIPCLALFLLLGNGAGLDNTVGVIKDTITLNLGIDDYTLAGAYVAQEYGDQYEYSDNMNNYQDGYDAPVVYRVRPYSYNDTDEKIELIRSFTRPEIECLENYYSFSVYYEEIDIGKVIVEDKIFYDEYVFLFDMQEYNKFVDKVS